MGKIIISEMGLQTSLKKQFDQNLFYTLVNDFIKSSFASPLKILFDINTTLWQSKLFLFLKIGS
jgi:hypothetical protein